MRGLCFYFSVNIISAILVDKLQFRLTEKGGQSKIEQLVNSVSQAIEAGELKKGESLPSINRLSSEAGFSRDTVFKAYKILKERELIESAPTRGYYVTGGTQKVFMLLDDFSAFKEQLYSSFRKELPGSWTVDLLFHHYNPDVFRQLVQGSLGRYSGYVVMNINHNGMEDILKKIDPSKLLILDMGMPGDESINYIVQDFNRAVEKCLEESSGYFEKYTEIIMVYDKNETPHPEETVNAVRRFCEKHGLEFKKINNTQKTDVEKGQCWFTIRDTDLVEVIKKCTAKGFRPGSDIGIISYNDSPMKEIAAGGITVISTNFEQMGFLAAEFMKNRQAIRKVLPTSMIIRHSL